MDASTRSHQISVTIRSLVVVCPELLDRLAKIIDELGRALSFDHPVGDGVFSAVAFWVDVD